MIENRSVPPNTVLPHVMYQNVDEAVTWLSKAFGFSEHYHYGDPTSGAQVHLGNAWIMLQKAREGSASPAQLGVAKQSLTVFVEDLEAHFQRAQAAGVKLLEDLHETVYGELQYAAEDLDGHHWLFLRHARDLSPGEWGATVTQAAYRLALLPRPRLCYLEIPAVDVGESAVFYEKIFGWNIRYNDRAHPSFDDATGNVSGTWVTGREPARNPGLLPYIWVDSIDATLTQVSGHHGVVVDGRSAHFPGSISSGATFRDPAGNMIGLYQEDSQ